jgi:hypothetical protein
VTLGRDFHRVTAKHAFPPETGASRSEEKLPAYVVDGVGWSTLGFIERPV